MKFLARIGIIKTMSGPTIFFKNFYWINISPLTREKLTFLKKGLRFHPLHIEDVRSIKTQRPKVDFTKDYLFLVLHFPLKTPGKRSIRIGELNVFLGKDFLITIHQKALPFVDRLFTRISKSEKKKERFLENGPAFLFYYLMERLLARSFSLVDGLGERIERIDKQIFSPKGRSILEEISFVRRDIILAHTILKPQITVFADLERKENEIIDPKFSGYWGDLSDNFKKLTDRLEDYRELIEGLASTYESLLTHRINEIMKVLTIFSAVLLPLSLLAGIYGMNIPLPFASSPYALLIISTIMFSLLSGMLFHFKKRGWI